MKGIIEMLKEKDLEVAKLKKDLRSLRQSTQYYKVYKALAEDGAIYVNTYTQDCDGVESYGSHSYTTLEEYKDGEESFNDCIEGRYSWDIVSKEDTRPTEDCGTFGQGWGIE